MAPLDFADLEAKLRKKLNVEKVSETDVMSAALYPKVAEDFFQNRAKWGPVDKLSTRQGWQSKVNIAKELKFGFFSRHFLIGPKIAEEFEVTIEQGKTLHFKTLAQSDDLNANGEREVFFELNGQLR